MNEFVQYERGAFAREVRRQIKAVAGALQGAPSVILQEGNAAPFLGTVLREWRKPGDRPLRAVSVGKGWIRKTVLSELEVILTRDEL